jgi:spore germination protein
MHKKIKRMIIFFVIIPFIFCGCWDQKIIEQTGFITVLGIESSTGGELNLTYGIPAIEPTTKAKDEVLDTSSALLRIARDKLRLQSAKTMEAGKLQYLLYSKEIAEKFSITNINEVFERDPTNPILAWVAVVDGSPRALLHLSIEYKDKPRPSVYITQLLERAAANAYIPETRVCDFDIINFAPGIDNIAPLIRFDSKAVEVQGSALFSSGKMVGTINVQETGLLMAMMKTLKHKKYTYFASGTSENENTPIHGLAILIGQKSKKINILIRDNKPVVDIYLDLYGYIDEYKWNNLNDEKEVKRLNSNIQGQIQRDCQKLLFYLQEMDSDPIGIGDRVRANHNNYWKTVNWHEVYKSATITAHVKFNIIQYGAIE